MANATQQSAAVNAANALGDLIVNQLLTLRSAVNEYVTKYNDANFSAVWNALPTAPANTDGSLGTADGSPNVAHPIDTRVVSTLRYPRSADDYVNAVAALQALQNFFTGGVVATLNRNQVLDLFSQQG
jgi:hypothetical protein